MTGVLTAVAAGAVMAMAAGPAIADDRVCRGTIGAITVEDDVKVPGGATCRLLGTRVEGNVKVQADGRLIARHVRIDGNVQTKRHRAVLLFRGTVHGNVQLERGRTAQVLRVTIDGDLRSFSNRGVQRFASNRIDGNLQCKSNTRRPVGGRNVVDGDKEGQCRHL